MCMQDLAIQARIVWRPVLNVVWGAPAGWAVIPPSPIRVALSAFEPFGAPASFCLLPVNSINGLNTTYDGANGFTYIKAVLRAEDAPGCFNTDLYAQADPANYKYMEAVMDSDLSKSVQRMNDIITQEVR